MRLTTIVQAAATRQASNIGVELSGFAGEHEFNLPAIMRRIQSEIGVLTKRKA